MEFGTYEELDELVNRNGGLVSCEMRHLRDAHGAGKLGVNVVQGISAELKKRGLSHWPTELPQYQWERARVYRQGTKISELYVAVGNVSEEGDEQLRDFAEGVADVTLQKIRELVCG